MPVYRQELSPIHLIERAGDVFADRVAVRDGDVTRTWRELRGRARRLASALRDKGVAPGDRVAFLSPNTEPLLLAHYGVPLAGGVLVAINTRLSPDEIRYILEHSGARYLFIDAELADRVVSPPAALQVIEVDAELEPLLAEGSDAPLADTLGDENDLITINYTSGTTGQPKGVMYHHRGAYLNALAMALEHRLTPESSYLWTLPMFHCNGWTFPWALSAVGARSVCLRKLDAELIWRELDAGITHFCAAPTVLGMMLNAVAAHRLDRSVRVFTAGAPPSPTLIAKLAEYNFELDHVYGLTETYGPFTMNYARDDEQDLSPAERAERRARQGQPNVCAGAVRVVNETLDDVPADGSTMGEVVMRGNVVMKGYYADDEATENAFAGGWFHSGDLAVRHPSGDIELRDRKKDIIISGGENISTIEVEQAVASHPAVLECAVIAIPDERWGEVPKAFVTIREDVSEEQIIDHVRQRLAHFKAPKAVEFCDLPKTSTGKIQKYLLRDREWSGRSRRIN